MKKLCHEREKGAGKVQEKLRTHMHAKAEKYRLGEQINSEEKKIIRKKLESLVENIMTEMKEMIQSIHDTMEKERMKH